MILEQFYLGCLAHASYLIGDESTHRAVVVDPQRDVDRYLAFAADHALTITDVFLTHFHADFIAGHLELRDRTGATIRLGRTAQAEYPFVPMGTGDRLELGQVRIDVLETPGHTPESISLLVYDLNAAGSAPATASATARADSAHAPHAVLTGDTLFVGDVGRPDLRASLGWSAVDLGGMLYDSVHEQLLTLPDSTIIMPAHGAGSLCGKSISKELTSTMGEQRRVNYALQPMSKEAFIDLVTADQPDAPPYFTYDAVLNTRERPTLDDALSRELRPLTLEEVLHAVAEGAQLLDTRDPVAFGAAHLASSLNIALGGQYATWAGTMLERGVPIVLVTDPGAEQESALRLGRIGFDHVLGYLDGGLAAASARPDLVRATRRLSPERAANDIGEPHGALAIDVRAPSELAARAIAGARPMPLTRLKDQLTALPTDRPLIVFCAGGYRSSIAASLLARHGFEDVSEIAGGITAWENAGLPVSREDPGTGVS